MKGDYEYKGGLGTKKQIQFKANIIFHGSAFRVQRQDQEKAI